MAKPLTDEEIEHIRKGGWPIGASRDELLATIDALKAKLAAERQRADEAVMWMNALTRTSAREQARAEAADAEVERLRADLVECEHIAHTATGIVVEDAGDGIGRIAVLPVMALRGEAMRLRGQVAALSDALRQALGLAYDMRRRAFGDVAMSGHHPVEQRAMSVEAACATVLDDTEAAAREVMARVWDEGARYVDEEWGSDDRHRWDDDNPYRTPKSTAGKADHD